MAYVVYHASETRNVACDGTRRTFAQRIYWHSNGNIKTPVIDRVSLYFLSVSQEDQFSGVGDWSRTPFLHHLETGIDIGQLRSHAEFVFFRRLLLRRG